MMLRGQVDSNFGQLGVHGSWWRPGGALLAPAPAENGATSGTYMVGTCSGRPTQLLHILLASGGPSPRRLPP